MSYCNSLRSRATKGCLEGKERGPPAPLDPSTGLRGIAPTGEREKEEWSTTVELEVREEGEDSWGGVSGLGF